MITDVRISGDTQQNFLQYNTTDVFSSSSEDSPDQI